MNNKPNIPNGFQDIIKGLADRKQRYFNRLEKLPFKYDTIPQKEMQQLKGVNRILLDAITKSENKFKSLDLVYGKNGEDNPEGYNNAKKVMEQKIISDLMATFDNIDVWSCKFSSESQGSGDNLTETPDDSIYYMSPSGASFRFKMANRDKGLKKVIQPIMEKIIFEQVDNGDTSETPKLGYFVREFATLDFIDQLKQDEINSDYQSPIKKYINGDKVEIPKLDNIKKHHEGSPVNKVYFEK